MPHRPHRHGTTVIGCASLSSAPSARRSGGWARTQRLSVEHRQQALGEGSSSSPTPHQWTTRTVVCRVLLVRYHQSPLRAHDSGFDPM